MRSPRCSFLARLALLAVLSMVLLGCNFPGLQPERDIFATFAANTVSARLTQHLPGTWPASDATPHAAATPVSTSAPYMTQAGSSPTATPTPAGCTDRLRFTKDVTVPDNTYMDPGKAFIKTWQVRNVGTCTWTEQYHLVFESGHIMGGPAEGVPLPSMVPPGEVVDLSVDLTSPATNGKYKGYWLLRNPKGQTFGYGEEADEAFWVLINVGPSPTPKPTRTPRPTRTPTPEPTDTVEPTLEGTAAP